MNVQFRQELYHHACNWVKEAGRNIRKNIGNPLTVDTKSNPNDLVTQVDKDTEAFFVSKIKNTYPSHGIVGEEGYGDELDTLKGTVWIIDPIDGTMNFVHQKRNFAISVGIYHDGIGEIGLIYDVMNDILYHARRGSGAFKNEFKLPLLEKNVQINQSIIGMNHFWLCQNNFVDVSKMQRFVKTIRGARTYGSAALEFAYVAEGIIDGYISMRLSPWDIAAGVVILNEVGGIVTDFDGLSLKMLEKNSIIACNPVIQSDILELTHG